MSDKTKLPVGREAIDEKGWWQAHKFLILRRLSQASRECRNCHKFDYMDFTLQENRAADSHQIALDEGKTCIDCHQGIAHRLPEGWEDRYDEGGEDLAAVGELPAMPGRERQAAELEGYLAVTE